MGARPPFVDYASDDPQLTDAERAFRAGYLLGREHGLMDYPSDVLNAAADYLKRHPPAPQILVDVAPRRAIAAMLAGCRRFKLTPVAVVLLMLSASPTAAQTLPTVGARNVAQWVSQITFGGTIGVAVVRSTKAPDRKWAFLEQGAQYGVGKITSLVLKPLVRSPRPCIPLPEGCGLEAPRANFPTGHTIDTASQVNWEYLYEGGDRRAGGYFAATLSLHIATAILRGASGKHSWTSIAISEAIGIAEHAAVHAAFRKWRN